MFFFSYSRSREQERLVDGGFSGIVFAGRLELLRGRDFALYAAKELSERSEFSEAAYAFSKIPAP